VINDNNNILHCPTENPIIGFVKNKNKTDANIGCSFKFPVKAGVKSRL
jgi:hypothetical protein